MEFVINSSHKKIKKLEINNKRSIKININDCLILLDVYSGCSNLSDKNVNISDIDTVFYSEKSDSYILDNGDSCTNLGDVLASISKDKKDKRRVR